MEEKKDGRKERRNEVEGKKIKVEKQEEMKEGRKNKERKKERKEIRNGETRK